MTSLVGKVALLTGALGTLGRAQARKLNAAGARLLLLDLPGRIDGQRLAAELGGSAATYVGADLRDPDAACTAVTRSIEHLGSGIDILINNAALIENTPFEQISLASYEEQIRINSTAAFALSKTVAPHMKARGYGKIINFCSVTLNGQWDGYTAYVASKGALLGLTKALARELGPAGVRVNAISPGAVVSEAEARVFGDRAEAYAAWVIEHQCLKRRIQPDDIAEVVLFLASPASDMISGHNLAVDGGW